VLPLPGAVFFPTEPACNPPNSQIFFTVKPPLGWGWYSSQTLAFILRDGPFGKGLRKLYFTRAKPHFGLLPGFICKSRPGPVSPFRQLWIFGLWGTMCLPFFQPRPGGSTGQVFSLIWKLLKPLFPGGFCTPPPSP